MAQVRTIQKTAQWILEESQGAETDYHSGDYDGLKARLEAIQQYARDLLEPLRVHIVWNEEKEILGAYSTLADAQAFVGDTVRDITEEKEGSEEWELLWECYTIFDVLLDTTAL